MSVHERLRRDFAEPYLCGIEMVQPGLCVWTMPRILNELIHGPRESVNMALLMKTFYDQSYLKAEYFLPSVV